VKREGESELAPFDQNLLIPSRFVSAPANCDSAGLKAVNRRVASSNLARGAKSSNQLESRRTRGFWVLGQLLFAQDIAHAEGAYKGSSRVNVLGLTMAGFQLTLHGRIWVIPEVESQYRFEA
jgi:hypothetical protein